LRHFWSWAVTLYSLIYAGIILVINIQKMWFYSDEAIFIFYAQELAVGGAYSYNYNPFGTSLLIYFLGTLISDFYLAAKILNSLFIFAFMLSYYRFLNRLLPIDQFIRPFLAWFSVIIWSLLPESFLFAHGLLTDFPYAVFLILSWTYLIDKETPDARSSIIAGFFGGCACLFRWTGFFFLPINVFIIIIRHQQSHLKTIVNRSHGQEISLIMFYTMSFFMILSPWLIYNSILNGNPFSNWAIYNLGSDGIAYSPEYILSEYGTFSRFFAVKWLYLCEKFFLNFLSIPWNLLNRVFTPMDLKSDLIPKSIIAGIFYILLGLCLVFIMKRTRSTDYTPDFSSNWKNRYKMLLSFRISLIIIIFLFGFFIQIALGWLVYRFFIPIFPLIIWIFLYPLLTHIDSFTHRKMNEKHKRIFCVVFSLLLAFMMFIFFLQGVISMIENLPL
jgi:hypothetical protein